MTPATETWLPVVGYEGCYEVSDHGRLRSVDRVVTRGGHSMKVSGRILRPGIGHAGRVGFPLKRDGQKTSKRVSVLVLTAFVGPRPPGYVGCHNDGDPTNNRLSNLRWDTQSANVRDAVRHGTHSETRKTHCKRGHSLAGPNVITTASRRGRRACRACHRATYARRKAQLCGEPFDMQQAADEQFERITQAA